MARIVHILIAETLPKFMTHHDHMVQECIGCRLCQWRREHQAGQVPVQLTAAPRAQIPPTPSPPEDHAPLPQRTKTRPKTGEGTVAWFVTGAASFSPNRSGHTWTLDQVLPAPRRSGRRGQ